MKLSPHTQKKRLILFALLALLSTVLCTVLRLWSLMQYYDAKLGYYDAGAALPMVSNILLLLSALGLIGFATFGFSKQELTLPAPSFGTRMAAIFPAVTAFAVAVIPLFTDVKQTIIALLPFDPTVLFRVASVLAVTVSIFFICVACGLFHNRKVNGLLVFFGFLAILYFLIALAIAYFDFSVQMNAPNKLIFQLACLGAMLFLLAELRILTDAQKPRFALLSFGVSTLLLGTSSLPSAIAYAAGFFQRDYTNLLPDLVCVALFCYSTVRLIVICFDDTDKRKPNDKVEASPESEPTDPAPTEENEN